VTLYLDTETTGRLAPIAPGYDAAQEPRIVSLAMVDADGRPIGYQRVNPGCAIPAEATRIHGIADLDVAAQPTLAEVWPRLLARVGDGATVVAHNAAFGRAVLACELRRLGLPLPAWRWGCTLTAARRRIPEARGAFTLRNLAEQLGLPDPTHSALDDARAAAALGRVIEERDAGWLADADPWHPLPADGAQVVAVTGHRHITEADARTVAAACEESTAQAWVFGGAMGVDTVALRAVRASHGLAWLQVIVPGTVAQQPPDARAAIEAYADEVVEMRGDLATKGPESAYARRNAAMVREASEVLAFLDARREGSGSRACAEYARGQGRAVRVVAIEGKTKR